MKTPLPHYLALSLCALAQGEQLAPYQAPAKQPHIILIMTDDQGYCNLSCLGNPYVKTPHIDKMYQQSVRLTQYHVCPTSAPTRAALMTGRYPFYSGISHTIYERERMHTQQPTLAGVMKLGGYKTGIFGKWHLGDEEPFQPQNRGFDEVFIHGAGGIGQTYAGSCGDVAGNSYFDPYIRHNGTFVKTSGFCTDVFFSQAKNWIAQQRASAPDSPLFVYIPTNAAHAPFYAPEESAALYQDVFPKHKNAQNYYGMMSNIDDNVGSLLAFLEQQGMSEDTVIIFTTDNGPVKPAKNPCFDAGLRAAKGSPYEGGTNAFFFFYQKGRTQSCDIDTLTMHLDVLPTCADLAQVEVPAACEVQGQSLLPLMRDDGKAVAQSAAWDRYFITHGARWPQGKMEEYKYTNMSVRNQRWKLVNNTELYDLQSDRGEKMNLAGQHPDIVAQLRAQFEAFWVDATPHLVNEDAAQSPYCPKINSYKQLFWAQMEAESQQKGRKK